LLLPICAPERSDIAGDQRDGYYVKVMDWTAWCAFKGKYNTCYGNAFQNPVIQEFVRFDGVPVRVGVKGISCGAMYRLWQAGAKYDDMVAMLIPQVRPAHKYPISPWEMIHPLGEIIQYAGNLTRFTRLCVTSHSQPLINTKYQVTN
jgi:hypothetical protein